MLRMLFIFFTKHFINEQNYYFIYQLTDQLIENIVKY